MNIRLKNRRIFTRILLGFMLILALAALMGGVWLYSLRGVTGVLSQITERSVPSIRYPTRVERYAMQTMLDVKSYLLLQDKEIHEEAMRGTQQIYANLDRLDEVATKHNDQDLLQKSRDVRRAVEEYQGYYNRGVALLKENQVLEDKMRMLGIKVNDLSHTHTLDHKRLLEEAIADGIDRNKRMEEFRLCNEIEKEALQASRHEKNYILYKKQEYFERLKRHIANLEKLYDEITKTSCVFEHQSMMKEIRQATKEYLKAAEKLVANDNELKEILTEMHEIGIKVRETARSVRETGWQEMDRRKKIAVLTTEKASLTGILAAAIIIIIGTVCAFFIARGLTRPIKELSQATTRIAEGDLKHRVRVQASDEIGQLAVSFNTMAESLQNRIAEIRRVKSFSANIIATVPDSLLVLDKDLRIKKANRSFYETFQTDPGKVIGSSITEILGDKDEKLSTELTRLFGTDDMLEHFELHYKSEKLGERIFNIKARGIIFAEEEEEEEEEELVVLQDITEHKRAEEKLRTSYVELQSGRDESIRSERLAFTGRIAASIAHEIRNPLTNVLMSVQQIKKAFKSENPWAKHIEMITRNTERINYLITELLNCARPPKLDMHPYDMHRLLEGVLESVQTKIKSQNVEVVKRFTSKPSIISMDKGQMERIFSNIILNAIEAMPRGGHLTIVTKVDGNLFVVKVEDTGEGIPEKDIIRIFDPFFSSKPSGVGLGLTICYGIIVSHGGTTEVESKPKEGTIFTVSLPVRDEKIEREL